ncbi:MAG: hypothetical protein ABSH20_06330 [Tepidisphaeraceae bacterium]|jgi:hypothetical protein
MKQLTPLAMLCIGPLLAGVAAAVACTAVQADMRNARGIAIGFAAGVVMGLVLLVPIATAETFRTILARALGPYAFRLQWYVSLAMAGSVGYIYGSRHEALNRFTGLAWVLVFFGATIKVMMSIIFEQDRQRVR